MHLSQRTLTTVLSIPLASSGLTAQDDGYCCFLDDLECLPAPNAEICEYYGAIFISDCSECMVPDPSGACCLSDGCQVLLQSTCEDSGGFFLGEQPCSENACYVPPPPSVINVPSDFSSIQTAIALSSDGHTINIAPGTYNEFDLNPGGKAITIQGTLNADGSLATTIDAQQDGRVFTIESGEGSGTVIKDLKITGGDGYPGGGILCKNSSSPTISGCTISGNTGYRGGGIYCWNSNPLITGCTIQGNTVSADGGGVGCSNSSPTISGCTISGNVSESFTTGGGGISSGSNSNPAIIDCMLSNNSRDVIYGPATIITSPRAPTGACCIAGTCMIGTEEDCTAAGGIYTDDGVACADGDCAPSCNADLNGDGVVDGFDLAVVLGAWGLPCEE